MIFLSGKISVIMRCDYEKIGKQELLKRVGSVEQIGGVKDFTYNDGKAKGVRVIEIEEVSVGQFDTTETDGRKNFLTLLYLCEELSEKYAQKGITEEILLDPLSDIGSWLNIWSELKGSLYLGETGWLKNHLSMNLFKLITKPKRSITHEMH